MDSIANIKMFNLAKDEGEKAFIDSINRSIFAPIQIYQASGIDDKDCHFDVKMLEYDMCLLRNAWHYVDVKDVEEHNFNTGNYVLRNSFLEYHTKLKPYGYYTAFRIVENGERTNKFVLVDTQTMLSFCNLIDKGEYKLVALSDIVNYCCPRYIEEEQIV